MIGAVLIGINKTGMPGLGAVPVVLLALMFETKLSTGLQLMLLCAADLFAVSYYRHHADWWIVLRLVPWALVGIGLGTLTLEVVDSETLRLLIGWIILLMGVISVLKSLYLKNIETIPRHWAFSAAFGMLAGFTTLVANAAGPVMAIYLLAMRLPKERYMGSCAWYFLILNYLKLPIFIWEGRITLPAVRADLAMLPLILLGAWLGVVLVRKLPQRSFERMIQVLIFLGALMVIFRNQVLALFS